MRFNHAYLFAAADARLVYDVSGGQIERPMPAGKAAPADAVSADWDAETLTLTCHLEGGDTAAITLTAQEIEDAAAE